MQTITTAIVKGCQVTWGIDGGIYFGRDLFDQMHANFQGQHFTANNFKQFEAVCKVLAA